MLLPFPSSHSSSGDFTTPSPHTILHLELDTENPSIQTSQISRETLQLIQLRSVQRGMQSVPFIYEPGPHEEQMFAAVGQSRQNELSQTLEQVPLWGSKPTTQEVQVGAASGHNTQLTVSSQILKQVPVASGANPVTQVSHTAAAVGQATQLTVSSQILTHRAVALSI